jgi:hypothetical protein
VQATVQRLMNASVIDKGRLFVKPSDLVCGISPSWSLSARQRKPPAKDVVSKSLLVKLRKPDLVCMRCGGRSEVGGEGAVAGHISLRWRAWEKMWTLRCICGGYWTGGSA